MFILPHGTLKDNIRSVNLDWRRRSSGRSNEGERSAGHSSEGERSTGFSSEGRDLRVTQANISCVFSGRRSNTHKGSPPQKKDMCELSLTVFLLHTRRRRRIKYKLYFYITTSFSLFVQRFNMRDKLQFIESLF